MAALVLLLFAAAAWYLVRRRRANRYRRVALAEARNLAHQQTCSLQEVLQLVRRTALTAQPATPLATLPGPALIQTLDRFSDGRLAAALGTTDSTPDMAAFLYGANSGMLDAEQRARVHRELDHWIRKHRREDLC